MGGIDVAAPTGGNALSDFTSHTAHSTVAWGGTRPADLVFDPTSAC
jgi:hypothetical protein